MSDKPMDEQETAKGAKRGGSGLVVVLVLIVGLAGGAAGAFLLLPRLQPSAPPSREAASDHAAAQPKGGFNDRLVQLEPFVVNVSGEGYPRYLEVQVAFELDSPAGKSSLEERMAQVRDTTILLLSSKRLGDVTDFEGKALLKDDLREQVNQILAQGRVESVLFTEFVVQ